jgi:hypothetical protein
MADPVDELLVKAMGKTNTGIGCVGVGTLLLGLFMIALQAFQLDKSASTMSTGGVIALYFFGGLFALLGGLMVYVGIVKGPARNKKLLRVVRENPTEIARAWGKVIKTRGAENLPGGQHCVCIQFASGEFYQLTVSAEMVEPLLQYLWQRAPGAAKTAK